MSRGRYEGAILSLLRDGGPQSRTHLSAVTGLSPTTVTKMVTPLIARGWVEELDDASDAVARPGRPAISIRQVPEAVIVAGVQIGVGVIRIGLVDAWGRVHAESSSRFETSRPGEEVIEAVADALLELIEEHPELPHPLSVGVAAPGAVDVDHRVNLLAVNLGWSELAVADILERRLGLPASVDHNVRAMALAEARYGMLGVDSIAYLYAHTGVGLGLVLHGEPLYGGSHGVSELGHIRVSEAGMTCSCGASGCLETVASAPYLRRRLLELGVNLTDDDSLLSALERERAAPEVENLRAEVVEHLSAALAMVVSLFSPDALILGGMFAHAPDELLADLGDAIEETVFPLLRGTVAIRRPTMIEPGIVGGAAIALERAVYGVATTSA